MATTTLTTQMNFRIDRDLKRRGDVGLQAMGYTPTLAVRRIWELASGTPDQRERLQEFLSSEERLESTQRERRMQAADEMTHLFERRLASLGITLDDLGEPKPYSKEDDRRMLVEALEEKYCPEQTHGSRP